LVFHSFRLQISVEKKQTARCDCLLQTQDYARASRDPEGVELKHNPDFSHPG
jgi:hypothetical protein